MKSLSERVLRSPNDLNGLSITVMGLGLNGGGLETSLFLARHGAKVCVTDLQNEEKLASSIEKLKDYDIRFVLGKHDEQDFINADIVIKNPAVRPQNPFLALAKRIESDLSLALSMIDNPVFAISGSKGKSTTASALAFGLLAADPRTKLGGNITVSPLSFFDELTHGCPLVLELSSFQLGDLQRSYSFQTQGRFKSFPPRFAIMTPIFSDHQDYYGSMQKYMDDKAVLFQNQSPSDHFIFRADDPWGREFAKQASGTTWGVWASDAKKTECTASPNAWIDELGQGWFSPDGQQAELLVPAQCRILGNHNKSNLLQAGVAMRLYGMNPISIQQRLQEFNGISHRLENFASSDSIRFVNDSAATIPEAVLAAISSITQPVHLICGGNNKELDFTPFLEIGKKASSITILQGSAFERIAQVLESGGISFSGPWQNLNQAIEQAVAQAKEKTKTQESVVLLSPGCTSFGMFQNEFDRGNQFKKSVLSFLDNTLQ